MNRVRDLIASVLMIASVNGAAETRVEVFATWEGFEVDKCASIWLIKRFIAPEAEIRFYPRGATISSGIPFDTPDAQFRRYHNKSTFETLQTHYQITDQGVIYIGRIIHDIEVNVWENKVMAETHQVIGEAQAIIEQKNPNKIIEDCQVYFDRLHDNTWPEVGTKPAE